MTPPKGSRALAELQTILCHPPTVGVGNSIQQAIAAMGNSADPGWDVVVVVDDSTPDLQVMGLLTQADVITWLSQTTAPGSTQVTVAEILPPRAPPLAAEAMPDVPTALAFLEQHQANHWPVVNDQNQLVGVISRDRLLQALSPLALYHQVTSLSAQVQNLSTEINDLNQRCIKEHVSKQQQDFSQLLVTLTSRFVAISADDLDREITHALSKIGDFMNVDTSYLAVFNHPDDPPATARMTHRWCHPSKATPDSPVVPIPLAGFPWATATLQRGETLQVAHVDALPDHQGTDRAHWQQLQVQALLSVPLTHPTGVVGYLGFASFTQSVHWSEETVQLLTVMAQTIASAQARIQVEQTLALSEAQNQAVLNAIPDLMFRIGADGRYRGLVTPYRDIALIPPTFDITGQSLFDILPERWAHKAFIRLQQTLATGELQIYEQRLPNGDRIQDEEVRLIKCGDDEALFIVRDISERKQAEAALRTSERHYQALISALPDLIVRLDANGIYQEFAASPTFDVVGNIDELVGTHVTDSLPPRAAQQRLAAIEQALASQTVQHYEQDLSTPDTLKIEEVRVVPYRDNEVLALVRDISDRRQAEQALQALNQSLERKVADRTNELHRQSQRLTLALQSGSIGCWDWDIHRNVTIWDERMYELYGLSPATHPTITFETWFRMIHPDDQGVVSALNDTILSRDNHFDIEFRIICPNGTMRHIKDYGLVVRDGEGRPQSIVGINFDISDRKHTELALQTSETQFRQLAENIPMVIYRYVLRPDGSDDFIYISPYIQTILGVTPQAVVSSSQTLFSLIHSDYLEPVQAAILESAQHLTPFHGEFQATALGGDQKWMQVMSLPAAQANGDIVWQGFILDCSDRKKAEIALQDSQQLLQTILDTFPQAVFWKNRQSVYLGCNQYFADTTGLATVESVIGKTDFEFSYAREEAIAYRTADQQVMTTGIPSLGVEEIVTLPNGEQRWLETNRLPLRDSTGTIVATVGTFQDITERKRTELDRQQLLQELTAFKMALDESAIVVMTDIEGVITYVNDRFVEISGYSKAELIGQTHRKVSSGYHSHYFFQDLWHTIQQGQVWRGEICNRDKKGQTYWVDSTIVPFLNERGEPVKFLTVRFDITDRKTAEIALQDSNNLLAIISQSQAQFITAANRLDIFDGLLTRLLDVTKSEYAFMGEVIFDANGTPRVDESFLKVKGIPQLQDYTLSNRGWETATQALWRDRPDHGLDFDYLNTLFGRVILTGQPVIVHYSCRRDVPRHTADGQPLVESFLGLPFFQGSHLVGVIGIANRPGGYDDEIIDYLDPFLVTCSNLVEGFRLERERCQTEEQLNQTNQALARATRLKDEFLANMSHELRTPLNAILGMTEGLQEEILGPITPKQLNALTIIERSGSHLLELINDILDVAKIESGQMQLDPTAIPVAPLCKASLAFVKQQALKKRIQLHTQVPEQLPCLWGDERRLRQVLINLLTNAVKFTPEGGDVSLTVQSQTIPGEEPQLSIAIQDSGIGIAPEHIDRLFQPFIQIDSALNRQYQGTGLGLTLVKQIVDLHGGQITLTSELGVGSCFVIELPCFNAGVVSSPRSAPMASDFQPNMDADQANPVILLAEDNEANIKTLCSYLGAKGYDIAIAHNGKEAIAQAQALVPDLILMDIQMPEMDGLEAMAQLRADPTFSDLPIIALTALAMEGDRDRCLAAGATDYLAKPVRLKELVQRIEALLKSGSTGSPR